MIRIPLQPLSSCLSEARDEAFNLPEFHFPHPYKKGTPGVPPVMGVCENHKIFLGKDFVNHSEWISEYALWTQGSPEVSTSFVIALRPHSLLLQVGICVGGAEAMVGKTAGTLG